MKVLNPDISVDLAAETAAMVRFTQERWGDVPAIADLFAMVRDAALHDARFWFDDTVLALYLHERLAARDAVLKSCLDPESAALAPLFDVPRQWTLNLLLQLSQVQDCARDIDGRWDFARRTDAVYARALAVWPELTKARPLGWDALREDYRDFDGMREYCTSTQVSDIQAFDGHDTTSAGAAGFPGRIALPYVMYDEVCQGRKAPRVLVSAIYAHFLSIASHQNTVAMLKELDGLPLGIDASHVVFELAVHPEHPLLKAALARMDVSEVLGDARTRYLDALQSKREFDAKPEHEQQAIRAEHKARMLQQLTLLGKSETSEASRAREEALAQRCRQVLLEATAG